MCDIQSLQLGGEGFTADGIPLGLSVLARTDCAFVNIDIRRNASDPTPILSAENVFAPQDDQPVPGAPPRTMTHNFSLANGPLVRCGEILVLTIVCAEDLNCSTTERTLVGCKGFEGAECPNTVVVNVAPPIDQTGDCTPARDYALEVVEPVGSDITFFWSSSPIGQPGSTIPGNGPTQTITVAPGDPARIISVIAIKAGCPPPPPGNVTFPAGEDVQCPTGFTVGVFQNGTQVAGPHTNVDGVDWDVPPVAPGTYTIRITDPASADSYEWSGNDGLLAGVGSSNEFAVTVNAGESTTTRFRIKPSDCCPAMVGSVRLTAEGSGPGNPEDPTDPGGDPGTEDPTDPGGQDPGTEDPVVDPPPPPPWFCVLLDYILAIALIVMLVGIVSSACAMLTPAAVPAIIVAAVAALIAAVLVLLICGPNWCHIVGILVWALKWAIVIGAVVALGCGSLISIFIVLLFGGIVAALIWWLVANGCRVPMMLGPP